MIKKNKLIEYIISGILDKKGKDVINISFGNIQNAVFDNFIICHGDSTTQVNAIAASIEEKVHINLKEHIGHHEGRDNAEWILLDFESIVVHIFQKHIRDRYKLEELWGDAEIFRIEESNT